MFIDCRARKFVQLHRNEMFNSSLGAGNIALRWSCSIELSRVYKHFAPTEQSHVVDKCLGA